MNIPWYQKYDHCKSLLLKKVEELNSRCQELGISSSAVFNEHRNELIARIAHESNWNEGIYLDYGHTKLLADIAISETIIEGPHLDYRQIERSHRYTIANLKRKGEPLEAVANYNLSLATHLLDVVALEAATKQNASLVVALKGLTTAMSELPDKFQLDVSISEAMTSAFALIEEREQEQEDSRLPLNVGRFSKGDLLLEYEKLHFDDLLHPFKQDNIHFLHRIVMTGILPARERGIFRRGPVHVGTEQIVFPPPSAVPALMEQFCHSFPTILPP